MWQYVILPSLMFGLFFLGKNSFTDLIESYLVGICTFRFSMIMKRYYFQPLKKFFAQLRGNITGWRMCLVQIFVILTGLVSVNMFVIGISRYGWVLEEKYQELMVKKCPVNLLFFNINLAGK